MKRQLLLTPLIPYFICTSLAAGAAAPTAEAVGRPIPICFVTSAAPNKEFADGAFEWSSSSTNDQYRSDISRCGYWIVDFHDYAPELTADWNHTVYSAAECQGMRVVNYAYTWNGSSWVSKGYVKASGVWQFGGCFPQTTSATFSGFGNGTKYRIAAYAYQRNCGGGVCYADYKRVRVQSLDIPQ